MDVIEIKTLEEALTAFYRSGSQQQSAAHDWLTKAQTSPQAWSFVWDLLQLGKVGISITANVCRTINFCMFQLAVRDAILWSHHTAHETDETLVRGAGGKSWRTKAEIARDNHLVWQWTENCVESALHCGPLISFNCWSAAFIHFFY